MNYEYAPFVEEVDITQRIRGIFNSSNCLNHYFLIIQISMANSLERDWGFSLTQSGIDYFSDDSQLTPSKLSDERIRNELLSMDFRTIPESCFEGVRIPVNASETMIVQLAKAVDISRPVGPEDEGSDGEESTEEEAPRPDQRSFKGAKRVLRLTLVSLGGSQRFEALEIRRIEALTDALVPGTKLLLRGPLRQHAGFVLLESGSSVKIVGGGVKRLADGWQLNKDVKARRHDLGGPADVSGPPKFISFLDFKKLSKQAKQALIPVAASAPASAQTVPEKDQPQRTLADSELASEKVKQLQGAKISADAFAMKSKGGKGVRRERTSRRERDELVEQYKPPSRSAPQLGAFVRLDKMTSLQDAQRLNDAMLEPQGFYRAEPQPEQQTFRGKGKGQPHYHDSGSTSNREDRRGQRYGGKGNGGKAQSGDQRGKGQSGKGQGGKGDGVKLQVGKGQRGKGFSGKGGKGSRQ